MRIWLSLIGCSVFALALANASAAGEPLTRDELEELVLGKTAACRKEKDQSICTTYFGEEGRVAQVMKDSGDRKDGVWFLDDADRLCILWAGKIKPLCFVVDETAEGEFRMVKNGKHLSSITALSHGNPDGL